MSMINAADKMVKVMEAWGIDNVYRPRQGTQSIQR